MLGSFARRASLLAAGAAVLASVAAAPVAADAAGVLAGPPPAASTPISQGSQGSAPDLLVTANGVEVDARGDTHYKFTVKNVGLGLAKDVKVTKLSQIRETADQRKVKKTITVLEYDAIPAGQEQFITIVCEKNLLYTCEYGSVTATSEITESSIDNNYAAQGA